MFEFNGHFQTVQSESSAVIALKWGVILCFGQMAQPPIQPASFVDRKSVYERLNKQLRALNLLIRSLLLLLIGFLIDD